MASCLHQAIRGPAHGTSLPVAFPERGLTSLLLQRMTSAPPSTGFPPLTHNDLPLPQDESGWRTFIYGRKIKAPKPPAAVDGANGHSSTQDEDTAMPLSLEDAKAAALASLEFDSPASPPRPVAPPPSAETPTPEPAYTIDPDHPAHIPSPSLLLSIPTPHVVRILSHFDEWFQERIEAYEAAISFVPSTIFAPPALRKKAVNGTAKTTTPALPSPRPLPARATPRPPLPTSHEAHWILSLLARSESLLAGDDISSLRILVRTVLGLVEESDKQQQAKEAKREAARGGPRSMEERNRDEEDAEGRAHCWMIVAAVAEGWAQKDLWNGD